VGASKERLESHAKDRQESFDEGGTGYRFGLKSKNVADRQRISRSAGLGWWCDLKSRKVG